MASGLGENGERVRIEVDHVAAFGLRRRQHRAVGAFDPAGAERHPVGVEVHVAPSQSEELCASRPSEGSEEHEGVHRLVAFTDMVEKVAQFVRGRRTELGTGGDDSMGAFDGVVPRPAPTHRLSER